MLLLLLLVATPLALAAQEAPHDTVLEVVALTRDTARLGRNPFRAIVRNRSDSTVLAVMDLRAEPGMWMIPNMQARYAARVGPRAQATIEAEYEFVRLSREGTLRVTIGPGHPAENGLLSFDEVDFRRTFDVGAASPDAFDPDTDFSVLRRAPLEIHAWKGSLAERRLGRIASERLSAVRAVEALLDVAAPERIRLVFYPDEATKLAQTGHRGVGWAHGRTLVEVYNDSIRLDPYHELTHVIAEAAGSPPAALREGLAVYATARLGGDALAFVGFRGEPLDVVACRLTGTPAYIPLRALLALDNVGSDAARAGREYAEAGSFVQYLVRARGMDRFRTAYARLDADADAGENVRRLAEIYETGLDRLERDWLGSLRAACRPER